MLPTDHGDRRSGLDRHRHHWGRGRLTGSGLGCDDWPNCNGERLIDVSSNHAAIEQVNRLFTGLVAVAVIAAGSARCGGSPAGAT